MAVLKGACTFFIGLLSLPVSHVFAKVNDVAEFEEAKGYLRDTVAALDWLTWYVEHHYEEGNLDLFIGTRIAEGQLSTLLLRLKEDRGRTVVPISDNFVRRLQFLADRLDFVTTRGAAVVQKTEPDYYEIRVVTPHLPKGLAGVPFLRIVKTPRAGRLLVAGIGEVLSQRVWSIDYAWLKLVNKTLILPVPKTEKLKESQSDSCIHTIINSAWHAGRCVIPDDCWNLMTARHLYGYSLTHQIFLLEIGAKVGCKNELQRLATQASTTLEDLADTICANVYGQAEEIADENFPVEKHDIFIEQTALCGILGYGNFFKSRWLDQILKWQMPQGCYGEGNLMAQMQSNSAAAEKSAQSSRLRDHRVKRQEKRMQDGCSAHRTAVAAAALGTYVKFLVLYANGIV